MAKLRERNVGKESQPFDTDCQEHASWLIMSGDIVRADGKIS